MQTVRLGKTNLEVSVAGLGCGGASRLGQAYGASVEEAADLVRYALDLGITFIDTARAYGTEEAVGQGIAGRRDQVVLSTKSAVTKGGVGRSDELITAAELAESLDLSLRRLGVDHVDIFHLHGVRLSQYPHCVEVLLPELERQRQAGKVRFLGITEAFGVDTHHEMLVHALQHPRFEVVMTGFNMLNPSARRWVFPHTRTHDVGTLIMFAVRRALSHPDALRQTIEALVNRGEVPRGALSKSEPLDFLTEGEEVGSVVEAAYRFARHEPGAHVVLTGTGKREHLRANIAAILEPPLPRDLLARLEALFGQVESTAGN